MSLLRGDMVNLVMLPCMCGDIPVVNDLTWLRFISSYSMEQFAYVSYPQHWINTASPNPHTLQVCVFSRGIQLLWHDLA